MSNNVVQTSVAERLILVETVAGANVGQSLSGLNVNLLPNGALVFVVETNRLYRLKKNVPANYVVDGAPFNNVVGAVGSAQGGGFFVAVLQLATVTLSGGAATITTFELSGTGQFQQTLNAPGGTLGVPPHTVKASATTATISTTTATDTSTYFVTFIETAN
jgi:hypothetical protein